MLIDHPAHDPRFMMPGFLALLSVAPARAVYLHPRGALSGTRYDPFLPICEYTSFRNDLTTDNEMASARSTVHDLKGVKRPCAAPERPCIPVCDDGCPPDIKCCAVVYTLLMRSACSCMWFAAGRLDTSGNLLCQKESTSIYYARDCEGHHKIGGPDLYGWRSDMCAWGPHTEPSALAPWFHLACIIKQTPRMHESRRSLALHSHARDPCTIAFPPPPSFPAGSSVTLSIATVGNLSEFYDNATMVQTTEAIASSLNVSALDMFVKVSPGSVVLTDTVAVPADSSQNALSSTVAVDFASAAAANNVLRAAGVSVTQVTLPLLEDEDTFTGGGESVRSCPPALASRPSPFFFSPLPAPAAPPVLPTTPTLPSLLPCLPLPPPY